MTDIMRVAVSAAREAGGVLLEGYGAAKGVRVKPDGSLVTLWDKRVERLVVRRIRGAFPSHGILAEEGSTGGRGSEYCWVIDPLDGTHNFIRGAGHFGVSIGVTRAGEFVAGVVNLPREKELYVAELGSGAWRNGKRIHVSRFRRLDQCSLCFDSSMRYAPDLMSAVMRDLGCRVFNLRMFGSSVRTLTSLAEGAVDAAVEFDDRPWDFAAGVVLIREAGGAVWALDGGRLTTSHRGYVATNGHVQKALWRIVDKHARGARRRAGACR